jgi:hypothetical protein
MDGVLVDSEPLHLQALNEVLAPLGHQATAAENEQFLGWTSEECWPGCVGSECGSHSPRPSRAPGSMPRSVRSAWLLSWGLAFALRNPATTQLLLDAADCVIDALAEWEPEQLLRQVALAAPVGHHWATDVG